MHTSVFLSSFQVMIHDLRTADIPFWGLIGLQVSLMILIRALGLKSEKPPAVHSTEFLPAID